MRGLRYTVVFGLAVLIISAVTVRAEKAAKQKGSEVAADAKSQKHAEKKIHAVHKEAAGATDAAQKDQMKKTEEMRKEAGKGSEQGQAMREEHSRKWWKFWGDKEPANPTPAK
jgi:hypothetical protein